MLYYTVLCMFVRIGGSTKDARFLCSCKTESTLCCKPQYREGLNLWHPQVFVAFTCRAPW